ncbi:MAG: fructose-6-phosphate aldolase [Gemmatimonadetes bacterium]|nr:fructose-6-phosphate aldolase [Gemmatimonadota bacterium]
MKLLVASASLADIGAACEAGLADGVYTTPALLHGADASADPFSQLDEICRLANRPVYAMVSAATTNDIVRDARDLARLSDVIVVRIPFVEDAVPAIRRLSAEGIRVAATLVFSPAQALLAAKAGASAVSVQLDSLEAQGQDGPAALADIHRLFEDFQVPCDILAVPVGSPARLLACAKAGADLCTVTPADLRAMLLHPLTDRGMDQFLSDLSRLRGGGAA